MLKNLLLDIFFPKRCIGCKKEGQYICKECEIFLSEINFAEASPCQNIMSVWEYEGIIEKAILKIKYDGCYDIIQELVEKAFEKIEINLSENAVIAFVPMYKKKEKQRGFNQAEIIAKKIGEKTNRKVVPLLTKMKDNRSQVGLNPKEHLENVAGAFAFTIPPKLMEVEPLLIKSVLLVDDVYTTGATIRECIRVLKGTGTENVYGFTVARKLSI